MPHTFAKIMFSPAAKRLQEQHGSRAAYERIAQSGSAEQAIGVEETEFITSRDNFYIATVTPDGWPYIQHRGGPKGFLKVLDQQNLAFADFSGNKQYISAGNLAENDRCALFLMDYPHQLRLKIIGHASILEPGVDLGLDKALAPSNPDGKPRPKVERILLLHVVGFDWNCNQYITPRYTRDDIDALGLLPEAGSD